MSPETTLVIGASGLVGKCLMQRLRECGGSPAGTYASRPSVGLSRLDIGDRSQVSACFRKLRPKTVFLSAALTHVDRCEVEPWEARRLNVIGPRAVAEEARHTGAKLVFYSTDYVFDGVSGPYDEEAIPQPLNVYGRTKLDAELVIREILEDALIVRTTVVFGWDRQSKNFAMQIYENVRAGSKMTVPADQVSTPTLASYLAEVSIRLARKDTRGIINVAGAECLSRCDLARALVALFGGVPDLVIPVATASLHQGAVRPLRGGLRTDKLSGILQEDAISLDESLQRLRGEMQRAGACPSQTT